MSDYQFQFFLGDVPAFVVAEKLTSEKVTWQAINKWSLRMHADPQGEEREIMKAMFPFMMTAFALVLAWIQEKYKALKAAVGVVSDEMKGALRKVGNGMLQLKAHTMYRELLTTQTGTWRTNPRVWAKLSFDAAEIIWNSRMAQMVKIELRPSVTDANLRYWRGLQQMYRVLLVDFESHRPAWTSQKHLLVRLEKLDKYIVLSSKSSAHVPHLPRLQISGQDGASILTNANLGNLVLGPAELQSLDWFNKVTAPSDSRLVTTHSPTQSVSEADMSTLMKDKEQLVDTVINAYLSLLTASVNGQFQIDPMRQRPGTTPMAVAFSVHLADTVTAQGMAWPPEFCPDTNAVEVGAYLFPMHIAGVPGQTEQGHWVLIALGKVDNKWHLVLLSSAPGYLEQAKARFLPIRDYWTKNFGGLPQLVEHPHQPQQENATDCGVFVLAHARRYLQGWSDGVVRQEIIPCLRQAFALELAQWRLR